MNMSTTEQGRRLNTLFEDMEQRLLYGDDQNISGEEALQGAVDWAFRDFTDDQRADLYAHLVEQRVLESSLRMRYAVMAMALRSWVNSRE